MAMSNQNGIFTSLLSRLTGQTDLKPLAGLVEPARTLRLAFAEQEGVQTELVIVGKREIGLVSRTGHGESAHYQSTILPLGNNHNHFVVTGFGPSRQEAVINALFNARRECRFRLDAIETLLLDIGLWQEKKDADDE